MGVTPPRPLARSLSAFVLALFAAASGARAQTFAISTVDRGAGERGHSPVFIDDVVLFQRTDSQVHIIRIVLNEKDDLFIHDASYDN